MSDIKVYNVNDCEWVASTSSEEARRWYLEDWIKESLDSEDEWCDFEPKELSDEEMENLTFNDPDGFLGGNKKKYSFKEALELMLKENEGKESFYFATTEY